ncbi:MAG: class I SAM-dependent methyltransferase [Acidobacteriota bacterium]
MSDGPNDCSPQNRSAPEALAALEELSDDLTARWTTPGLAASLLEYLHACPVCGSTDLGHYVRVPSLFEADRFIVYERCRGCGVVLRNPRLPAALRLQIYEDKVLPPDQKRLLPRNQRHYRHVLRLIRRAAPPAGRVLDFGCGAGGFLLAARDAGFDVLGLEVNKYLARHVEESYEIPVFRGLIEDPAFGDERFAAILTSQVFEHLLDPRGTLATLRRHLLPGGLLLIEVPNQRAFKERRRKGSTMDDSHYFYFDAASLRRLYEDQGFEVVWVSEGARLYRLLPALVHLPAPLLELAGRVVARLGLRTGLSMLARRR